jgi:hypothetical protein
MSRTEGEEAAVSTDADSIATLSVACGRLDRAIVARLLVVFDGGADLAGSFGSKTGHP